MRGRDLSQRVLLNANEKPDGPQQISIDAMSRVLARSGRYHDEDTEQLTTVIASAEQVRPDEVLVGCGSSEILHCAVDAFTSPILPLITTLPSYELPVDMASALGHPVIKVAMTADYAADVRKMVAQAEKSKGGLIYVVNPNNPTSSITKKDDIAWLVANLPANTIALIDEAYMHFADTPEMESGLTYVRQGKDVVVARTFSKIYGMAGLRAGFAAARPGLIQKMEPFRNNVISIVSARAVLAAIADKKLVPERKATLGRTRSEICAWLRTKGVHYLEPQGNFLMIDVGRDTRDFGREMAQRGVAVGRPFPPLDHMLRVTVGTDAEMAKFRDVFWVVYGA